ncbi:MAG: hypothetical protein KF788_11555 [Piscinibacter sp.]|nr:hypothetical protein [Piscinibacter sp.]
MARSVQRLQIPTRRLARILALCAGVCAIAAAAAAAPKTVCTITVNSADEKEAFRRYLPASRYRFVELVEPGRPDWLASACRAGVRCDVLIVSGHYDGANEFFSDRLEAREYLPVAELERVSCSASCPGLFERLQEVYLFGCNTLNPAPQSSASAEVVRSLVREGHSAKEARRQLQALNATQGESSRERMRQIFKDVPVIYGFSSAAPLGPIAGSTLERYLRAGGARDVARGHPSGRLLGYFAPFAMTAAAGITGQDPGIAARRDMCQFADERRSDAARLAFVHELLGRHVGEMRLQLDRIQRLMAGLDEAARRQPAVARELDSIAHDTAVRDRFLAYARGLDDPPVRVRLVNLARELGWLDADQRWQEFALMLGELLDRPALDVPEIGLACELNQDGDLDGAFGRRGPPADPSGAAAEDVAHAAVRACLGSSEARARVLAALVGTSEPEVRLAQAYLRQRPIEQPAELRRVAMAIAAMDPGEAQVRALEALGRHYVADREVLDGLAKLYARTPSAAVQNAIAGILIRADRDSVAAVGLPRVLREHRLPAHGDDSLVGTLIERLPMP